MNNNAVIEDVKLAYDVHGSPGGRPVVLVGGQGMPRALWQLTIVPPLVDAGLRVLCYDARGVGESAAPPGPYSVPQLADDLAGLLDHLGWGRTGLCGISLGGMVGEYLAATRPDLVSRAALLASTSTPTAFQHAYAAARAAVAGRPPVSDELNMLLELLITVPPDELRDDTQLARTTLSLLQRRGSYGSGFVDQGLAGDAWAVSQRRRQLWADINVPCLLLAFEHDLLFPPHAVREAVGAIAGARYALIRDVAHGSALVKAAGEIGELLGAFFAE
jgi:thioesterase CepJ